MTPVRIQRSRAKGYRLPPGAIYVGRPTRWGNPFPIAGSWTVWAAVARGFRADLPGRTAAVVAFYREWLAEAKAEGPHAGEQAGDAIEYESGVVLDTAEVVRDMAAAFASCLYRISVPTPPPIDEIRAALRGHDLACFCALDKPCHADVLLEIANR